MIACLRSFAIAVILLHFCKLSVEVRHIGYNVFHSYLVCAEADPGEEDSDEYEDDDMATGFLPPLFGRATNIAISDLEFISFEDHVGEMVLPPPLA